MIVIEYPEAMNARQRPDGITVLRGKMDGKPVYVAERGELKFWASKPEYAIREIQMEIQRS